MLNPQIFNTRKMQLHPRYLCLPAEPSCLIFQTRNFHGTLANYNRYIGKKLKTTALKETQKRLRSPTTIERREVKRTKYGCKRVRRRQNNSSCFILRCLFSFRAQNEMRLTSHNFSDNVFLRQPSIQLTLRLTENRDFELRTAAAR